MQLKLFKQFLTVFLSFTASFIFAQDQIKINKIEVNGIEYNNSTAIPLFKNNSATFKVNYTITKFTPNNQENGVQVTFNARMITGSPFLISYNNQMYPNTYGQSKTFEFTTSIQNASALIYDDDKGELFLTYEYGSSKKTSSTTQKINLYNQPVNIIHTDRQTDYMTEAPEVSGTNAFIPYSNVTYVWQRKNPMGNWYNLNNVNSSNRDYVAPASENKSNYRLRRVVKYSNNAQHISNEVAINVNIDENSIHETVQNIGGNLKNILIGSLPKGGNNSYSYQWQELINNSWSSITGATSKDYELPTNAANRTYRRIVASQLVINNYSNHLKANGLNVINNIINVQGNNGNLHSTEKVSIGEKPYLNILITGAGANVKSNTGQPLIIQWQKKTDGGNWEDISGATSENYIINSPLYQTTQYKRIGKSLYAPDNESNIITFEISSYPKMDNNIISFDPANNDHILGTTPTGGDNSYSYIWVLDVHPDDSIGEMIQWSFSPATDTFLSEYYNSLPITSDEIRITRYAISDNVWHRSNTLIYSSSGGIIQGRKASQAQLKQEPEKKKETIAFIQNNELKFNFKNYQNYQAEIYIGNIATGQSVKATNHNIKNNNDSYTWNFPSHFLPGVYVYRIIFSDGSIKSGKVIRK